MPYPDNFNAFACDVASRGWRPTVENRARALHHSLTAIRETAARLTILLSAHEAVHGDYGLGKPADELMTDLGEATGEPPTLESCRDRIQEMEG